jgi:hypothetical protein
MTAYTAKVIGTDPILKLMTVEYVAVGHDPIVVSMKFPFTDQQVADVIKQCAPTVMWDQAARGLQSVQVGHTESMSTETPLIPAPSSVTPSANFQMWADIELEKKIAKALVKFGVLASDPTEIPVTKL